MSAGFVTRHRGIRFSFDRNPHGQGWWLAVRLGPGAGYRWVDLPGYSPDVKHRVRRRLTISGRTMVVGSRVKISHLYGARWARRRNRWGMIVGRRGERGRFYATALSIRANRDVFPGWW